MKTLKYLAFATSLACLVSLTGCVSDSTPSGTSYPEYEKWWTQHPVEGHVDEFGIRTYTQLL